VFHHTLDDRGSCWNKVLHLQDPLRLPASKQTVCLILKTKAQSIIPELSRQP
jgi:hypothetical protein